MKLSFLSFAFKELPVKFKVIAWKRFSLKVMQQRYKIRLMDVTTSYCRIRNNLEDGRDPSFNSSQLTASTPSDKGGRRTGAIPKTPRPQLNDVEERGPDEVVLNQRRFRRVGESTGERVQAGDVMVGNTRYRRVEESVDMMDDTVGVFSPRRNTSENRDVRGATPGSNRGSRVDKRAKSLESLRASGSAIDGRQSTLQITGPSEYHTAVSSVSLQMEEESEREGARSKSPERKKSPRKSDKRKNTGNGSD